MSDAMQENAQGPDAPEPDARPPVSPPVQGTAPAWEDPAPESLSSQPPPADQLALEAHAREALHGFSVEQGGRGGITNTAERIGSAVGNAQREVRRRLELVRRPHESSNIAGEAVERASHAAREGVDRAARMMAGIEEEVSGARRQAVVKLDTWSEQAGERFQQLRQQARVAFARTQVRARELADAYPLQTIAAVAGICFAVGLTLRFSRRSHRG
jgi:hypothetical protein